MFIGLTGLYLSAEPDKPITPTGEAAPAITKPADAKEVSDDKNQVLTGEFGEKIYLKEKKIELEGYIASSRMPLELFSCAEGGKDYESVAVVKCRPQNIHLALILFGLKEGVSSRAFGDPGKPVGPPVLIFLEWEKDGQVISYRGEDLVIDTRTQKPMPRMGWIFTGSKFVDEIDYDTQKPTGKKIYLANSTKTLIATYHDPAAILDNPSESGGAGNIYLPNKEITPERGTKIKLIIRLPNEQELKELKKVNDEVDQWERDFRAKQELEKKEPEKK